MARPEKPAALDQLRNEAKERGIKGRSRMNKDQVEEVLSL